MKYRNKSVVIEATQWFKNWDHPKDDTKVFRSKFMIGRGLEGKVVRYYRTPNTDRQNKCKHCGHRMHNHGWIDTLEGGHTVCLGDWIITEVEAEGEYYYPCKPDIFEKNYYLINTEYIK